MEKILVLNAGSTTVKFQLYQMDENKNEVVTGGVVERIGLEGSKIVVDNTFTTELPLANHKAAIKAILGYLTQKYLRKASELAAVAHRMGYGGKYSTSAAIDADVMQQLYDSIPLIPLHGPAIEKGIKAMQEIVPSVLQVAVFDTAFHQSIKKEGYLYALPREYITHDKIRRYGFHGPSHNYETDLASKYLGFKGKFICCHLGGGASVTAVKDGKSVMTTMGYTPMSWIVMSTRPGDIDPNIPLHIMKTQQKTADEVNAILNKQSGLYALSGGYTDMRDILGEAQKGNQQCIFALEAYTYSLLKAIGAGIAVLGGLDALIFTGGIGEKGTVIRQKLCDKLNYLGLKLDLNANSVTPAPTKISSDDSKIQVLVIPTNEELMMAKEAYAVYMKNTADHRKAI